MLTSIATSSTSSILSPTSSKRRSVSFAVDHNNVKQHGHHSDLGIIVRDTKKTALNVSSGGNNDESTSTTMHMDDDDDSCCYYEDEYYYQKEKWNPNSAINPMYSSETTITNRRYDDDDVSLQMEDIFPQHQQQQQENQRRTTGSGNNSNNSLSISELNHNHNNSSTSSTNSQRFARNLKRIDLLHGTHNLNVDYLNDSDELNSDIINNIDHDKINDDDDDDDYVILNDNDGIDATQSESSSSFTSHWNDNIDGQDVKATQ